MQERTSFPLRRTRDFGETISDTTLFLKENWKQLLLLYMIFVVPFLLLGTLLGAQHFPSFFSGLTQGMPDVRKLLAMFGPQLLITILLYMTAAVLYPTTVYVYMRLFESGGDRRPALGECAAMLFGKSTSNFGYALLSMLLFILTAVLAVIPFFGIIAVFFGVFFLLINFSVLLPVNTIEDNPFPDSLRRAFRLVKERWWLTLGVATVIFMIYYFFASIIGFTSMMISGIASVNFLDPKAGMGMFSKKYFLVTGFSTILQQAFYLILHVGLGIHYFSLCEEKDGSGLEAQLDSLGTGGPGSRTEEQY
jgi:hypothetical protein